MLARRIALAGLALAGALAFSAPAAQAGLVVPSSESCEDRALSKPFLPWLDVADYVLAPSGTFENAADGWDLRGGAAVGDGNESFHVSGEADAKSLHLPAGSSAQSAAMCVGIDHPTLRFFVRRNGGTALSSLRVDVLYENRLGLLETLTIGTTGGGSSWAPTSVMVITPSLLPLLPGDYTPVAFRFVPQGSASWQVDDVYVDPFAKR